MARDVVVKSSIIYTVCNVILRGISFLTVPIFIRLLSPEEFGKYNIFVSFEGILFIFSALSIHVSVKNARYDFTSSYDEYIKNCVYVDFFNSILLALIANTICYFWSSVIDLNFVEINLLVLSGFCQAVISIYSTKLVMDYRSVDFVFVSIITVLVGIGSSLFLIFTLYNQDHYLGRVIGGVFGQVSAMIFVLYKLFNNGFAHINTHFWRYGIKISVPIIPHGLSQIALSSANRIMIKYFYNASLAGIFSFTYTVSLIPQVLFTSLSSVWEPWFFENMYNNNKIRIKQISIDFTALISVVFIFMACIVPELVHILATPDYEDAIDISVIVLLGCYFATLYYIPCEVEYFHKKTTYIAISTVASALLNIGLNFILMQTFSYKIAAYVTSFTYFCYFLSHFIIANRLEPRLFDERKMILIILLSTLCICIVLFCLRIIWLRLFLLLFVLIFTYARYKDMMRTIFVLIKNKVL